ncbi:hypothetical protein GOBAR_DD15145 [Gossypium barbadense]|nr:hypothetical protein GOBAR_DD15145 [Gossypium barbadense]
MEYCKKLALVLAMMVVAATTTATEDRNELTETLSIEAIWNATLMIKTALKNLDFACFRTRFAVMTARASGCACFADKNKDSD